ncbi:hypothetical protein ACH42_03095 [Endozoicomonas sp. (ex Bugula neritina AB1)]|nr:hypothetical protein ACH42_03095 [Endozoicomonas sp. (ex Bugula neritina AB1)]
MSGIVLEICSKSDRLLDTIADVARGKFSARPRNDPKYFNGKYPFVQTGDVSACTLFLKSYSQTLNEQGLTVSKLFPKDTILITIAANIGDVAITEFSVACPDSVVGIQTQLKECSSFWLYYALSTKKEELDSKATQNAQKNINLQVLNPLAFAIPPIPEQNKIAAVLLSTDKKLQQLSEQKTQTQQLKKGLMQQLLTGQIRVTPEPQDY